MKHIYFDGKRLFAVQCVKCGIDRNVELVKNKYGEWGFAFLPEETTCVCGAKTVLVRHVAETE